MTGDIGERPISFSDEFVVLDVDKKISYDLLIGYPTIMEVDLLNFLKKEIKRADSKNNYVEIEDFLLEPTPIIEEIIPVSVQGFMVNKTLREAIEHVIMEFIEAEYRPTSDELPALKIELKKNEEFKSKQLRRTP
ncbi:hypothetical protein ADUPG1_005660, partial [Aduncisulcus paluster]